MRIQLLGSALLALTTSLTAQSPLTTLFAQNNGGAAGWTMYFDLVVNAPVAIQSMDVNLNSGTTGSLDVYWTPGTYVGNVTNVGVWTLGGSGPVTNAGINVPSNCVLSPIVLPPGNYGIAVVHNGVGPAYTNGSGTAVPGSGSNQTYSTAELTMLCGASAGGGLGTAICCEPRVMNCSIHYTVSGGGTVALRTPYGQGCYDRASTFYELFAASTFDLSNTSFMMIPAGGGYAVLPGSNQWFTPVAANLGLTDDSVSQPQNLPLPLATPRGVTNQLWISSNGFIWTQASTVNGCCNGDGALFLSGAERFAPLWTDLNPAAGGSVHFDVDPTTQAAYVTFLGVREYGQSVTNDFQVAFLPGGIVEYRYQNCAVIGHTTLTGYTPGNNGRNPGSRDLSSVIPFVTGPDSAPLSLSSGRPVIGTTFNLVTANIPTGTQVGAVVLSFSAMLPPLNLAIMGMPDCYQRVGLDESLVFLPSGASHSMPITLPNNPRFVGQHLYCQSASFSPGVNTLGVLTSNAVDLLVGNV